MRIVVIGYGKLFQSVVEGCLINAQNIVGVMRVNRIRYSPFMNFIIDHLLPDNDKMFVDRLKLNDINAPSVNCEKFRKILVELNPDIVFVSSWGEKFQPETYKIPKIGTINLHPSLLPKYRGPNPYFHAIKNGEKETGLTFHLMDSSFDTGAILQQTVIPITPNETGDSLRNKCSVYAREEVQKLLNELDNGFITPINQSEKYASYFHQLTLYDSILSFTTETSEQLDRRIRGSIPWMKCTIPCGNDFFLFGDYKILEQATEEKFAHIIENDGKTVKISTVDKKVMQFDNVRPVRLIPKFLHKWYVKTFLKGIAK